MSAKLLKQLLWDPLPDPLPAFGWWIFPPQPGPGAAAGTSSEAGQAGVDPRVRRSAVQALVRNAYLVTVAEQDSEHRPPVPFGRAWQARLTAMLAQATAGPTDQAPIRITDSDLDFTWRLYELARRARLNAMQSVTATPSQRVQRGKPVPTFEFSVISGGDALGEVTYGTCRLCSTGMLYTIEFTPDWQFCGLGRLALSQLETRHPDLTWYTTGQLSGARGFCERYRQDNASPWTGQECPCPHLGSQKGDYMTETVYPRGGGPVALRPCPPWCIEDRHFNEGYVVHADDGYHHYGPAILIPTADRMLVDSPEIVVKVFLKSWTHPLDAEPGPGTIELQLGTAEENTDMCVDLTPTEARAVAAALLKTADIAERTFH